MFGMRLSTFYLILVSITTILPPITTADLYLFGLVSFYRIVIVKTEDDKKRLKGIK